MNEQLRHHDSGEKLDLNVDVNKNLEHARSQAEKAHEATSEQLDKLRRSVEQSAISGREVTVGEQEAAPSHSFGTHKQLKHQSYKRTLAHIQSRLSRPEKLLSKTIHRQTIDRLSTIGGATVARPTGLLGGGLAALVGSVFSLYLAKRYGFTYNFSIFILLFVGGYLISTLLELSLGLFKKSKA